MNTFENLNTQELIQLAIKTMQNTLGQDLKKTDIEISYIDSQSLIIKKLK